MTRIRYTEQTPVAWANGGGVTVELVSLAVSAELTPGLPRWRLSIATLQRPAPFSPLPGVLRQFMPIGGDVVLTINGVRTPVAAGTVCHFDGADEVDLVDLTTVCNAVNLMVEHGTLTEVIHTPPQSYPQGYPQEGKPVHKFRLRHIAPDTPRHSSTNTPQTIGAVLLNPPHASERFDLVLQENSQHQDPPINYADTFNGSWAAIEKS